LSSSVKILTFSKSFNLFKNEESTFLLFLFKEMLKLGQTYIIDPLCKLFNNMLSTGKFPVVWAKGIESKFLYFLFKLLKYLNHSSPGISSDGELELGLSK
jgi:hypothetical protein